MTFRTAATITGAVTLVLGVGYLVAGAVLMGRWNLDPTTSALLLGRRMGALYLGLSVMFFTARAAPLSVARSALSTGSAVACLLLACLGVFEFVAGRASAGILASALLEVLIAAAFITVLIGERRTGKARGGAPPVEPATVSG